ncbi:glycoside hydrolase family 3 protein [Lentiprolixibacter aurantiacus]|uniref:beta-N-acetylhexosaminidase n=1 Tax=Lentiprolixibacter aurantiacus TaxID=2993939 RepID=A0AAE3MMX8_9FLAO|nr:glycoside hydrolase family 3 protein [Lentiprolixibacter aurantiacus]MCX2720394.1 glycoside hydrolase family 3 protein [Lentiprolixibacter aurantiacus]
MNSSFDFSDEAAAQLSLQQKVGQLFMPAAFINDSEEEILKLEELIRECGIGGICFFHSRASAATNYEGKKEVPYNEDSFATLKSLIKRYQEAAQIPLLIAIDAEWGLAMRIENTPCYPYALTLGAMRNANKLVYQAGSQVGADCRAAGIHWNFAPVADINNNPDNPVIGYRSFGSDKKQVSDYAIAFAKGMQSQGVLSSAKHFPGHGDTATDSHLGIPLIDKSRAELEANELFPFKELIASGVDSVMIGHLAVPALSRDQNLPATLSDKIIKGVLRKDMGFDGVVVSDALNMHAVSRSFKEKGELEFRAFEAGIDLFCFSENPVEGIQKICEKGNQAAIDESFQRIWRLKSRSIPINGSDKSELTNPHSLNLEIARRSLTQMGPDSHLFAQNEIAVTGIQLGSAGNDLLFNKLRETGRLREIIVDRQNPEIAPGQLSPEDTILLSLNPPLVKPAGNFGFSEHTISFINDLLKFANVTICLFGNPYFLNLLELNPNQKVLIAYQHFDEFQHIALEYLTGRCKAPGKLPVKLKCDSNEKA